MGYYIFPINGRRPITDDFSEHKKRGSVAPGVDFAVKIGTPVYAARAGRVKVAIVGKGSGGTMVEISHAKGTHRSGYKHLSKLAVKVGQHVAQGQLIGYSGNTGNTTGAHLHFDLRVLRRYVDPLKYLA
jgi:murein DD-endopeptidase MepM/ murein hydrolase activator NlpD